MGLEDLGRYTVALKAPGDVFKEWGLLYLLEEELPTAIRPLLRREGVLMVSIQAVDERDLVAVMLENRPNVEEPQGLYPEVKGSEVMDPRVYQ